MREIATPTGEVYCFVEVKDGSLRIRINQGSSKGYEFRLDEKIIPQLRNILAEYEFFKSI